MLKQKLGFLDYGLDTLKRFQSLIHENIKEIYSFSKYNFKIEDNTLKITFTDDEYSVKAGNSIVALYNAYATPAFDMNINFERKVFPDDNVKREIYIRLLEKEAYFQELERLIGNNLISFKSRSILSNIRMSKTGWNVLDYIDGNPFDNENTIKKFDILNTHGYIIKNPIFEAFAELYCKVGFEFITDKYGQFIIKAKSVEEQRIINAKIRDKLKQNDNYFNFVYNCLYEIKIDECYRNIRIVLNNNKPHAVRERLGELYKKHLHQKDKVTKLYQRAQPNVI